MHHRLRQDWCLTDKLYPAASVHVLLAGLNTYRVSQFGCRPHMPLINHMRIIHTGKPAGQAHALRGRRRRCAPRAACGMVPLISSLSCAG